MIGQRVYVFWNFTCKLLIQFRYLLMDFSLLSSIRSFPNLLVTVSYDIMCQYSKKLYQRIAAYPQILHTLTPFPRYQLLVPKFHLAAHKQDCVWSFSYNYAIGVGRTDGEGVKCNWSTQNSLSGSTKKMGPGIHRDTLDDHFGDHNWWKIISIGTPVNFSNTFPQSLNFAFSKSYS
jgi:Kyakuja-Dileera-Zisupton transposase